MILEQLHNYNYYTSQAQYQINCLWVEGNSNHPEPVWHWRVRPLDLRHYKN